MIELKDVTKSFDTKTVFEKVCFKLDKGQIMGVIGPNGSGKTTLINVIMNNLDFDGQVMIENIPNFHFIENNRENISFVSDSPFVYDFLTGIEFIKFNLDLHRLSYKQVNSEIDALISLFSLQDYKHRLITEYSFGMKRKISLISTFLLKPKYFLLDEPVLGLDLKSIIAVKELLAIHAKSGSTIILSSHSFDLLENLCSKIGILHDQRVTLYDNTNDMSKRELGVIYRNIIGEEIKEWLENYSTNFPD